MPRPLPFDRPETYSWPGDVHQSPTSTASTPPFSTPRRVASPSTNLSTPPSPFYGLEPEAVARHFERPSHFPSIAPDSTFQDPIRTPTTSADATSYRTRRFSASSINPARPQTRVRTPSPPAQPFDSNEGSTSAWLRWLGERRARRIEAEGGDGAIAARNPNDPLRRLRQSAERLRTMESNAGRGIETRNLVSPPSETLEAYDESRRLLFEVRERLEDTRSRIEDARALIGEGEDNNGPPEYSERIAQARQGLDRTVAFAARLGQLASTLTDLSERASALTNSARNPPPSSSRHSSRSPTTRSSSTAIDLESPSSADQTDNIRNTVRQLIVASRRVSAAIDRHRAAQQEASSSSMSHSAASGSNPPLPPTNLPLRVSLPSPLRSSTSTSVLDPLGALNTSSNPDGLLLPSRPFTHSPLSFASPNLTLTQQAENYPGERAQLLRIASLQRDIASRALELRELRTRGRELDREEQESRRATIARGGASLQLEADKDDDDDDARTVRRLGRGVEVEACRTGDEAKVPVRLQTRAERKRRYETYAICGR